MVASKYSRNHFTSEIQQQYNYLNYISFKILSLCNFTLLSATVRVLETFLEAIL